MDYDNSVYRILIQVPKGKVTTYKLIACALGKPGSFRAVGNALGRNPDLDNVPCYRVVKSGGSIGGYAGGVQEKIRRLRADGINVKDGRILELEKILFTPKPLKRL
jgi:methylated-DNA-[protein]-cysteine S-methyltransferase